MKEFDSHILRQLYVPPLVSHKGQNGKLMIIGGSHLFHAASLLSLAVASRIVDMVFYSSVPENNEIVHELKREFRGGIVVRRQDIENYIKEADCVLIGPGMLRTERSKIKDQKSKPRLKTQNLKEINGIVDEGMQSYLLTKYLLEKYPKKKWVIDAGALQMMEPEWLKQLHGEVVITPHTREFEMVFAEDIKNQRSKIKNITPSNSAGRQNSKVEEELASEMAKKYNCVILLKGQQDIVCSPQKSVKVGGGNAGMTKGGTGDVLAGLVAALACKNSLWLSAVCGSYINKKAGDRLFDKVGYYFNSSDLADEIPRVMAELLSDFHKIRQA